MRAHSIASAQAARIAVVSYFYAAGVERGHEGHPGARGEAGPAEARKPHPRAEELGCIEEMMDTLRIIKSRLRKSKA